MQLWELLLGNTIIKSLLNGAKQAKWGPGADWQSEDGPTGVINRAIFTADLTINIIGNYV